jgi:predicted phosphoadenosine phosphosulfate sulfurtransferase
MVWGYVGAECARGLCGYRVCAGDMWVQSVRRVHGVQSVDEASSFCYHY